MTSPADFARLMPFAGLIGISVETATPEEVVALLPYHDSHTTAGGTLHGGALMALADSAGGVCAFLNLPPEAGTSTISSSTVFLRGVRSGTVTATARPLHVGRTTIAVATELRDDDGRLVAQVTQTQAVLATA